MLQGLCPLLARPSASLGFHLSGPIFGGATFRDFNAEGLADVLLRPDERGYAALATLVLDAPDGAHLVKNIQRSGELLLQLGFPDVLHL